MTDELLIGHITTGLKVLYRVRNSIERTDAIRLLFDKAKTLGVQSLEIRRFSNKVRCVNSGGFVHYVARDDEVMGHEYHTSVGGLTATMRSRVRL